MSTATEIVAAVMTDLRDRKGFNWWFDDIDPDIQTEITDELTATVAALLESTDG